MIYIPQKCWEYAKDLWQNDDILLSDKSGIANMGFHTFEVIIKKHT
jgi:hypothetical protein